MSKFELHNDDPATSDSLSLERRSADEWLLELAAGDSAFRFDRPGIKTLRDRLNRELEETRPTGDYKYGPGFKALVKTYEPTESLTWAEAVTRLNRGHAVRRTGSAESLVPKDGVILRFSEFGYGEAYLTSAEIFATDWEDVGLEKGNELRADVIVFSDEQKAELDRRRGLPCVPHEDVIARMEKRLGVKLEDSK